MPGAMESRNGKASGRTQTSQPLVKTFLLQSVPPRSTVHLSIPGLQDVINGFLKNNINPSGGIFVPPWLLYSS